jgi:hypothetical protein
VAGGISPSGQNLVEKYNIQTGTHYNSHYLQSLIETRFDSQEITTEIRLRNTVKRGEGGGDSGVTPPAPRLSLKCFMTTSSIHSSLVIYLFHELQGPKTEFLFCLSELSTNSNNTLFNYFFVSSRMKMILYNDIFKSKNRIFYHITTFSTLGVFMNQFPTSP